MQYVTRCLPLVLAGWVVTSLQGQTPNFIPGQILARFADGTRGQAAVIEASETDPVDLEGLVSVTSALAAKIGVPLQATAVGSGYWVVFSVDATQLGEQVAGHLRDLPSVEAVEVRAGAGPPAATSAVPSLVLDVADGSDAADAIAGALAGDQQELSRLIDSWSRDVGTPLRGEVTDGDRMLVYPDLRGITLTVIDAFNALPEIEAAQPNYSQSGFGRGAGGA